MKPSKKDAIDLRTSRTTSLPKSRKFVAITSRKTRYKQFRLSADKTSSMCLAVSSS